MSLKLKIHMKQERNILYGWIEEQDESLRNKKWFGPTTILDKGNFKIRSFGKPYFAIDGLYLRGKTKESDSNAFCMEFSSNTEAHIYATMIRNMIDELNGTSVENMSKDWSNT